MQHALTLDYTAHRSPGRAPFGFTAHGDGTPLTIVTRELVLVGLILERRGEGWSLRRIARAMMEAGHRTKAGRERWSAEGVSLICRRAVRYRNALRSRNLLPAQCEGRE